MQLRNADFLENDFDIKSTFFMLERGKSYLHAAQ